MRLGFYVKDGKKVDRRLAESVRAGAGARVDILDDIRPGYDLYAVIGVKSAESIWRLTKEGRPFVYFDKGYNRRWPEWWRVAVNGHQPTPYLDRLRFDHKRARRQGWTVKHWRRGGDHVVLAGSSAKYHLLHGLDHPTAYAEGLIRQIRKRTARGIVYRPKPSWRDAVPVAGTSYAGRARYGIERDLAGAHVMVTHGSNACLDALLAGVPAIVLGPGVTAGISSTTLDGIEDPKLAGGMACRQLLANLAYCQWSLKEFESGKAWKSLVSIIDAAT